MLLKISFSLTETFIHYLKHNFLYFTLLLTGIKKKKKAAHSWPSILNRKPLFTMMSKMIKGVIAYHSTVS